MSSSQDLFLGFGKKATKEDANIVVKRFANGTIDWGTPGNRPYAKPVEYYQTFEQIVTGAGFFYEEYTVTTADGYILDVYRIKSKDTEAGAPVVFFQHGLLSCATTWIIHYPDLAPAFVMVKNGYDVWLGNNRGTTFSRKHIKLNPDKDRKFWAYSFTELGDFDLPAQIDFVLEKTKAEKLSYVGHS